MSLEALMAEGARVWRLALAVGFLRSPFAVSSEGRSDWVRTSERTLEEYRSVQQARLLACFY